MVPRSSRFLSLLKSGHCNEKIGIGDSVVAIPVVEAVRQHYGPESKITVLHNRPTGATVSAAAVLERCGLVDEFVAYDAPEQLPAKLTAASKLWWSLLKGRYDAVVYALGCGRSLGRVRRDRLFFKFCLIRETVGFRTLSRDLYTQASNGQVVHEAVARLMRLAEDGIDISGIDLSRPFLTPPESEVAAAAQWLSGRRRYRDSKLVAICPGSKQAAKLWPRECFAELGRMLLRTYDVELVVVGGTEDQATAEALIAEWKSGINASGLFSVWGSAALLTQCEFAITLDSGPMHLAAACGTRCLAVFSGQNSPGRWDPLGLGHIILRNSIPCSGCGFAICPLSDHPCMRGLHVNAVWAAVVRMCESVGIVPPPPRSSQDIETSPQSIEKQ